MVDVRAALDLVVGGQRDFYICSLSSTYVSLFFSFYI